MIRMFMSRMILVVVIVFSQVTLSQSYHYSGTIPGLVLTYPRAVEVDSEGNVFVGDYYSIYKFDSTGRLLRTWGGVESGQFKGIASVDFNSQGKLYVAEWVGQRVKIFDSDTQVVTEWDYAFPRSPTGLVINSQDLVYVASEDGMVRKFDPNGNLVSSLNIPGAKDVDVDSQDYVYIVDRLNHRILKYDSNEAYVTQWGGLGIGDGQFTSPTGIAIDQEDHVYVVSDHRVQQFDKNGIFLSSWTDEEILTNPAIAVDDQGSVYLTEYVINGPIHRVRKFDVNGIVIFVLGEGLFNRVGNMAMDDNDNIYFSEIPADYPKYIKKYDSDHNLIRKTLYGGYRISGMAVDRQECLYVGDSFHSYSYPHVFHSCTVHKFDQDGNELFSFGSYGTGPGQFSDIEGLSVDSQNNIYVVDPANKRIQKFSPSGNYIGTVGQIGIQYFDIVFDSQDNFYVTSKVAHNVTKYAPNGSFVVWGGQGQDPGQFWEPQGITVDKSDNIYVADCLNNRIQKFDSAGNLVGIIRDYEGASDVGVNSIGRVYVINELSEKATFFNDTAIELMEPLNGQIRVKVTFTGILQQSTDGKIWSDITLSPTSPWVTVADQECILYRSR